MKRNGAVCLFLYDTVGMRRVSKNTQKEKHVNYNPAIRIVTILRLL
jgi:hypothetical protein